ncbi:MAG: DNA-binding transcriptional regulator Fis [Gammaproteobacteria bacterium]|jgi:Fis family transcriptional regulator, factor for inversion stimulation protein|nr:DNA-binding transcriptional regulator Fis [Gammaproteobacteria bacterium]MBT5205346.1 DNA-binding transcriptional regulator Fis [Gammaproteobacteria bacterium]MBT5601505.1 DNA-binding transcriptional regulator Fis [Gammaproteobacteria bacterium]MBT6244078.1 DNA-binding transcriptional regulator Fis [Gammaproteobacteria bacterium]
MKKDRQPSEAGVEAPVTSTKGVAAAVDEALTDYFRMMSGETIEGLYELVLSEVEPTVLAKVMEYTAHNQSKAAEILGLNRGTLRSKLKKYQLL